MAVRHFFGDGRGVEPAQALDAGHVALEPALAGRDHRQRAAPRAQHQRGQLGAPARAVWQARAHQVGVVEQVLQRLGGWRVLGGLQRAGVHRLTQALGLHRGAQQPGQKHHAFMQRHRARCEHGVQVVGKFRNAGGGHQGLESRHSRRQGGNRSSHGLQNRQARPFLSGRRAARPVHPPDSARKRKFGVGRVRSGRKQQGRLAATRPQAAYRPVTFSQPPRPGGKPAKRPAPSPVTGGPPIRPPSRGLQCGSARPGGASLHQRRQRAWPHSCRRDAQHRCWPCPSRQANDPASGPHPAGHRRTAG